MTQTTSFSELLQQLVSVRHQFDKLLANVESRDYLIISEIGKELRMFERSRRSVINNKFEFNLLQLVSLDPNTWFNLLNKNDVLSLGLCCSHAFAILSPVISARMHFSQINDTKIVHYSPEKLLRVDNLDNVPKSVQRLFLRSSFNAPITHLPPSITHLTLNDGYSQPITNLPLSIVHLVIGRGFTSSIVFPPSLTHLSMNDVPQNTFQTLPLSLTNLTLKQMSLFSHVFDLSKLKELRILDTPSKELLHLLPPSLELLIVEGEDQDSENLPSSLLELTLHCNSPVDHLPPLLSTLVLDGRFNQSVDHLPSSLTQLTLGQEFNHPVDHLPSSITLLSFGDRFNQPIDHLPPSLTHLSLGSNFNQTVQLLPPSIVHLTFGYFFNQPIDKLPPKLRYLYLGTLCNQIVSGFPSLNHLCLSSRINNRTDSLPPSLTHLYFGISNFEMERQRMFKVPSMQYNHITLPLLSRFYYRARTSDTIQQHIKVPLSLNQITYEIESTHMHDTDTVVLLNICFDTREVFIFYNGGK